MAPGRPTLLLPTLSPWPAPLTCLTQTCRLRASLSFSDRSWGALDSDVTSLSRLLQWGPLDPPGATVRGGTVRGSRKCCLFICFVCNTPCMIQFAQRAFLFLKHFENPWLTRALALHLQRITPPHLCLSAQHSPRFVPWALNCGPKAMILEMTSSTPIHDSLTR